MNEQNAIDVLIGGAGVAAFIGCWIGCYTISDNGEMEMKKKRQALKRGATNYVRMQAVLAVSSEVIKGGKY